MGDVLTLCDSLETLRSERDEARIAVEVREATIARLRATIEQLKRPTPQHYAWERHMEGTPPGTRAMPVYLTEDGEIIVNGPPDAREGRHDCDDLGCSSVHHVAWRGNVDDLWPLLWGIDRDRARDVLRRVLAAQGWPAFNLQPAMTIAEMLDGDLAALRVEAEREVGS